MIFILRKVRSFIEENNLIKEGDTVIVGLSGGADSVFMLHILTCLSKELGITVVAGHVNHQLRGEEAIRDEKFAETFAKKLGVPFHLHNEDVKATAKKMSVSEEEAGREVRYRFFGELCGKYKNAKIATAHNKNDNAETVLMHLIRGSGVSGLCGIPCRRENIIRPILDISRDEIEEYCRENGLEFVTDSTNLKSIYTRNKVRLELIPYLQKNFNPEIVTALCNMSENMRNTDEFLEKYTHENTQNIVSADGIVIEKLKALPKAVAERVIIKYAKENGISPENIHIKKIWDIIKNPVTGKRIDVPGGVAYISYGNLKFSDAIAGENEYQFEINENSDITLFGWHIKSDETGNFEFPENSKIEIRSRRDGDRIKAGGMTKKIKKIFIDKKIPENERNSYPLITVDGEVVCILGLTKGDFFKNKFSHKKVLNIYKEENTNA